MAVYVRLGWVGRKVDLGDLEDVILVVAIAELERRLAGDFVVIVESDRHLVPPLQTRR